MEDMKSEKNDQAKELRELLNEVNNHSEENNKQNLDDEDNLFLDKEEVSQINSEDKAISVLNLPPRKEVHNQNKNRTHLKVSRPFIRLTLVVVLLLSVIGLLLFYGDIEINF